MCRCRCFHPDTANAGRVPSKEDHANGFIFTSHPRKIWIYLVFKSIEHVAGLIFTIPVSSSPVTHYRTVVFARERLRERPEFRPEV